MISFIVKTVLTLNVLSRRLSFLFTKMTTQNILVKVMISLKIVRVDISTI